MSTIYKPLDADRKEVRIAALNPGQFDDEIHCNLYTISLNDSPPYKALSYVWGSGNSGQIHINGLPKLVTKNLETALRHLRHVSESKPLWIDAICINQKNVLERNEQVLLMGRVYSTATEVMAWLGEESEDSDLAFDAFEGLPRDKQVHWDPLQSNALDQKFLDPSYGKAVNHLALRPWWSRIWTVQESVLAKSLLFCCGRRQIPADILFDVVSHIAQHFRSCCKNFFAIQAPQLLFREFQSPVMQLYEQRDLRLQFSLAQILSVFRSRACADPRDKVYGLLGICSKSGTTRIVPDYSLSVSLVYEQAARNMIESSQTLDVFSQLFAVESRDFEPAITGLHSWAPDWTLLSLSAVRFLSLRQKQVQNYNASLDALVSLISIRSESHGQGRIACSGRLLTSISDVGIPALTDKAMFVDRFKKWRELAGIDTLPNRSYLGKESTTRHDAYCQTLCAAILPMRSFQTIDEYSGASDNASWRSWHDAWWKWVTEFGAKPESMDSVSSEYGRADLDAFRVQLNIVLKMRTFFLSKDGEFMGLCPSNAQVGDVVVILAGGKVPYILRESKEHVGCYEILGDAYVHGIMDGEAWDSEDLQEIVLV